MINNIDSVSNKSFNLLLETRLKKYIHSKKTAS